MKILFVNAPPLVKLGITGQMFPPLGILYLAAYLRKIRPETTLMVLDGYKEEPSLMMERISSFQPDVLGVSFTTQAAGGAYRLINAVKEQNTNVFIVAGGAHPTALPEEVLSESLCDLVVAGEGEETLAEIVSCLSQGIVPKGITGTVEREQGNRERIVRNPSRPYINDLDSIPFPARDLIDLESYPGFLYKKENRDTAIISARGCPFDCVYCSNPVWKEQKPWFRLRTPQNVVDEMEMLVKEYGITEFFDQTDEFNGNIKWAKAVCDEIVNRGLNISLKAQMRVDNIDRELVGKLKDSGFWMGIFGLESANADTLKGTQKKQTVEQAENALRLMKESNVKAFGLFMGFNVWEEEGKLRFENREDSLKTLAYVRSLIDRKLISLFGWSMTTPYPGSHLYQIALRHNLIDKKHIGKWEQFDSGSNFIMKLPGVTQSDWITVADAGKRLQARLLLTSGAFNVKAIPLYLRKLAMLLKRRLLSLANGGNA